MNGFIILAAGPSSRLGTPKQLLVYRNKSLLRHVIEEALSSNLGPVWVVVNTEKTMVTLDIQHLEANVIINHSWAEGMASSIRIGVTAVLKHQPTTGSVILSVCDQPFVSVMLFQELLTKMQHFGKGIVACSYDNTLGTPVAFGAKYFSLLQQLSGHQGAKKILTLYNEDVASIPFEKGYVDIDTVADYEALMKGQ